eukprot:CAMPEP_0181303894 /NCGR_PEP_ID=MMETSP1101-20121128/8827_1 /TAXON_ID=46948 /ORGANISM="Rhodomonas abbreviata, Strain Caron Lab Isolate" /LENGTH=115 /DNA_ID=CAMNT_0023409549 /DNA_START=259 /DNA_END=606 /DNA_ORIENTATION=-
MHSAIPVLGGVGLKRGVEHREDNFSALGDERHNVFIVPEEESPLGNLEVGRVYAAGYEEEKGLRDFSKLSRLRELEKLLELVEEHHLLLTVCVRPILDQPTQDLLRKQREQRGRA